MEISFYSQCLHHGIDEINVTLRKCGNHHVYHFIDFNHFYLSKILQTGMSDCSRGKNIILSDRTLIPLAFFYFENLNSVVSVVNSKMKINDVVEWVLEINGMKAVPPSIKKIRGLSYNEIVILGKVMSGESVSAIALNMSLSRKTIYSKKLQIAGKLGIRRIEDLLIERLPDNKKCF